MGGSVPVQAIAIGNEQLLVAGSNTLGEVQLVAVEFGVTQL
jgi:hypothetical protein